MKGDLLDPKGREIIGMNSTNAMRIITAEQQQQELLLFRCVLCGISEGDSSNLTTQQSQLQTNATVGCGHQFCTRCVERELSKRREFPCPICETAVKRVTLSTRTLDEVQCEKDTSWRRRILKVFNKVESDFDSLQDYNRYLEEVEDIIYCIVNEEPNAEEMKGRVKEYEEANKAEIVVRQSQRAEEERNVADQIMAEKREVERKKRECWEVSQALAVAKRKMQQEAREVLLGEREEVSEEVRAAQIQGYRNELLRARRRAQLSLTHGNSSSTATFATSMLQDRGPMVREPEGGLLHHHEKKLDRETYRKRQSAAAAIDGTNLASLERCWILAETSLFAPILLWGGTSRGDENSGIHAK